MNATLQAPALRTLGRVAALFYLLTIVTGIIAQVVISDRLTGSGDVTTIVSSITLQEPLYRLGFTIYLIEMACQAAWSVLFYQIMREVSRPIAQVALALGLVGCTIKLLSRLFYYAPLLIMSLGGLGSDQQSALVQLALALNNYGAGMALPFFGLASLLNGYLAFRSGFLPRWLGVASMIGGAGWLSFLSPSLGLQVFPLVAVMALLGSLAWITWLLAVGVPDPRRV